MYGNYARLEEYGATPQYVSMLSTCISVAMITRHEMYVILSKLPVLVFAQQSGQIQLPELCAQCLRELFYSVSVATVLCYDATPR